MSELTTANYAIRYPDAANNGTTFAADVGHLATDIDTALRTKGQYAFRVVSGTVTAAAGDLINANASAVVNLPAAASNIGVAITTSSVTSGSTPVTVRYGSGGGNIFGPGLGAGGASQFLLGAPNVSVELQSDGANWNMMPGSQQDTGWVALTPPAGFSAYAAGYPPAARLRGDTVSLRGGFQNNTGGTAGVNITIPAQFRPASLPISPYITGANIWDFTTVSNLNFGIAVTSGFVMGLDGISYPIS